MRPRTPSLFVVIVCSALAAAGCSSGCGDEPPPIAPPAADPFSARSSDGFGARAAPGSASVVRRLDGDSLRRRGSDRPNIVVYLDAEPDAGGAPLEVRFTAELDEEQPDAELEWDFGDGTVEYGLLERTHRYEKHGEYEARLTVIVDSERETETVDIDVEEVAFDVSMDADPDSGPVPLRVAFAAEVIDDIDGPFTYHWEFGDGATATAPTATHIYRTPGDYIAKVVVESTNGQRGVEEFEINAEPAD